MNPDKYNKFLEGNYSREQLDELKKLLHSEDGSGLIDHLFDKFYVEESENDKALESRLLEKIRGKIKVEELITEITKEYKRQEKILDKSRNPVNNGRKKKRLKRLFIAGSIAVVLVIGFFFTYTSEYVRNEFDTPEITFVNKSTGKGQKLTLHLSDGTKVILNSRSSIKYPESFTDSTREVYVEGEAFFEVAHNKRKPFIVHAGHLTSRVLGTSFNIRYKPEDNLNVVALVTGKVQVKVEDRQDLESYVLAPGEAMELNTLKGTIQKQKFDIQKEIGWKDNIIYFTDADYQDVFERLENWYGVEISYAEKDKRPSWNLTAKFENENLENILNALSLSQGIHYELNEKSVKIKF